MGELYIDSTAVSFLGKMRVTDVDERAVHFNYLKEGPNFILQLDSFCKLRRQGKLTLCDK